MDNELAQVKRHNTFTDFTGRYAERSGTQIDLLTKIEGIIAHEYLYNDLMEIYLWQCL